MRCHLADLQGDSITEPPVSENKNGATGKVAPFCEFKVVDGTGIEPVTPTMSS